MLLALSSVASEEWIGAITSSGGDVHGVAANAGFTTSCDRLLHYRLAERLSPR